MNLIYLGSIKRNCSIYISR